MPVLQVVFPWFNPAINKSEIWPVLQWSKAETLTEKHSELFKILAQHSASALHHCALYSSMFEMVKKKKQTPKQNANTCSD